jgi:hypothetical protein
MFEDLRCVDTIGLSKLVVGCTYCPRIDTWTRWTPKLRCLAGGVRNEG